MDYTSRTLLHSEIYNSLALALIACLAVSSSKGYKAFHALLKKYSAHALFLLTLIFPKLFLPSKRNIAHFDILLRPALWIARHSILFPGAESSYLNPTIEIHYFFCAWATVFIST